MRVKIDAEFPLSDWHTFITSLRDSVERNSIDDNLNLCSLKDFWLPSDKEHVVEVKVEPKELLELKMWQNMWIRLHNWK